MAKKNQKFVKEDEQLESVNQTLTGAGKWIEDHSTLLISCVVGIAVVILGVMLLKQEVFNKKALLASNENAKSVIFFMAGDYEKALVGDEEAECEGFLNTAKKYGFYQEGKLAALYAGLCYFEKGEYEDAVEYLKKYSSNDLTIGPAAKQKLGDAYIELQDYTNAIKAFEAAAKSGNEIIAPMSLKKAGLAYLHEDNKAKALKAFQTIKEKYPASTEAQDIDKYIAIAE